MLVRILGDLEVEQDGRAVALGSHKPRAVLAILALHAGDAVSADRLIDGLWGDTPPATAAKALQVYVSRLRRAVADATHRGDVIVTRDHAYPCRSVATSST